MGSRRGLPKFREILRRPRPDSELDSSFDSPDIEFEYDDCECPSDELAELYSYTEFGEFADNHRCFTAMVPDSENQRWLDMSESKRRRNVLKLIDAMDMADDARRLPAIRALLYLAQGSFRECATCEEQERACRENCLLLYECGVFSVVAELLNMEIMNGSSASAALQKPAVSIADSLHLRLLLNLLYTLNETLRGGENSDDVRLKAAFESFRSELMQPMVGDETLVVILFSMVTKFCGGTAPHFPMKKVLLLLWKVMLLTLGGLNKLHAMKNKLRVENNLPLLTEDTHEVCRQMRASSPPISAVDLIEAQSAASKRGKQAASTSKKLLLKQDSLGDPFDTDNSNDNAMETDASKSGSDDDLIPGTPRPSSPVQEYSMKLPWTPKVRQKDIEHFLEHTRNKFVGLQVRDDVASLAGLPQPIHEGVKVLKQHLYISLAELQVQREEEITRNPLSRGEREIPETPAELLYRALLPSLPQYMIALLKILLAAAPTSKAKTDSINILADVLPEEMPSSVLHSMKLGIDVNRHKEIVVKAIGALLLLLLKYLKLNHIYQFEYMSQHLVFANCIPLVLKFFNQNINSYVTAKNGIAVLDFPMCVLGDGIELTAESLEQGDTMQFCWRNLFSCINLLRILNKLTKWKHSRTMMLVVFKSAPILKRALRVKHAMMQLYILKLLKMQTKYLGRMWRKGNMKTMSAIYQKVRHRLTDDWAFGNDIDARPWDFQAEECALRACVDRFNNRRYSGESDDSEFEPVDNCIISVLGEDVELSEDFKENYEKWLESEVFSTQIDWNQVLAK